MQPAGHPLLLLRGLIGQLAARLTEQLLGLPARLCRDGACLLGHRVLDLATRLLGARGHLTRLILGDLGRRAVRRLTLHREILRLGQQWR